MTFQNPNRKSIVAAAITAGFLILLLGVVHRVLAIRLLLPTSKIHISSDALDSFPFQIQDWTGENVPLNDAKIILDMICADAYINRQYVRDNNSESIQLFIAASGVTAETTIGHSPEVCNVKSGYMIEDQRYLELLTDRGTPIPCKIIQFSQGSILGQERKTVLYYYMADGWFCNNSMRLWKRIHRGPSVVNCAAQVQISALSNIIQPKELATKLVCDFAADSASRIATLLENIKKDQSPVTP